MAREKTKLVVDKAKTIYGEFKAFAMRGNVIDLAVGVIIGTAFGKITTALVADVFNPVIGILIGRFNFSGMYVSLDGKHYDTLALAQAASAPVIAYGDFINVVIDFIITAFALFIIIRQINKLKRHEDKTAKTADPDTKKCPYCVSTIPANAIRCPFCTSEMPATPKETAEAKADREKASK